MPPTQSALASIGTGVIANTWAGKPINPGAAGYSPQGKGYGSNPIPSPFASLLNSAFGSKQGQQNFLQKFAASLHEGCSRANGAGAVQQAPMREASAAEVFGHGLGGLGMGGGQYLG